MKKNFFGTMVVAAVLFGTYTYNEIPNEKMNKILQAGLLAPTSRNLKPCNFLVIENKETLKKISKSKAFGASFVKDANKAIAVIANIEISDTGYWKLLDPNTFKKIKIGKIIRRPRT